jgi:hypothetical protein
MDEKIFAGLLTLALVLAFVFSIEAVAQLQRPRVTTTITKALSSDLKIFDEQVP